MLESWPKWREKKTFTPFLTPVIIVLSHLVFKVYYVYGGLSYYI